jgi:hypothetical protein
MASPLKVWSAAISHICYDTGEIMAGRERLAEDAETTPEHASHALTQLVEIGALLKLRRGRYAINREFSKTIADRSSACGHRNAPRGW